MREPAEVVEGVDHPLEHVGLPAQMRLLPLARGALAEVVVLRGEAEVLVPLLGECAL